MSHLIQTFNWLDLAVPVFPLLTGILAFRMSYRVWLSQERGLTWCLSLLPSVPTCFAVFGFLFCINYFSARLAGADASWQLILICGDVSLAAVALLFIALVAFAPFFHIFLSYWWRQNQNPWFGLIGGISLIVAMAVGVLAMHSQLLSSILFGDPKAHEDIFAGQLIATNRDFSLRFSVVLDRLSYVLGFNRSTGFDIVATAVTVAAILQGIAAVFSLYDRFLRKKGKKSNDHDHKLPPARPISTRRR